MRQMDSRQNTDPVGSLGQKLEISKEEVNLLPLWEYQGKIELLEHESSFNEAAERMREAARIGIDTETRPAFRKGQSYPVALLQLALADIVYLVRLNRHGLPTGFREVLENPNIQKVGIAQKDDVRELKRDFGCQPEGILDLNIICRDLGYKSIGARKLAALILGKRISKSQQTTNWERPELSRRQMVYAATDAWICREIYERLHPGCDG